MAVYGSYFLQDGRKETLSQPNRWGSCWAYFNKAQSKWDSEGGEVELYILSLADKVSKHFIESEFFQTLTRGSVTIDDWRPTAFNGADLPAELKGKAVIIKCDPTKINANRWVTAMRLISSTRQATTNGTPLALRKYLPMLWLGRAVSGSVYSDSHVTLYPTTFASLTDCWENFRDEEGWDEYEDIGLFTWINSIKDASPTRCGVSLEMLARIWNRTDEEMEALCPQKEHIFAGGYYKDCEVQYMIYVDDEWEREFNPDDIITISAPITDVSLKGETIVGTLDFGTELRTLAKLIKNK